MSVADRHPHVDLTDFETPGMAILISGRQRTGKTSLQEWLGWAYHKGINFDIHPHEYGFETRLVHWVIPKETVIVRDFGSFSWLGLSNPPYSCKLKVHIPKGALFEPDERQVTKENIMIEEFEPTDLLSLFDKFKEADAGEYIHVIEFDVYVQDNPILRSQFWRYFITGLARWKSDHRNLRLCLILDEFQMITKTRRGGSQQRDLKMQSEVITDVLVMAFGKYWIRVIVSCTPLKAMDENLRGQFPYIMMKQTSFNDIKGTVAEEPWKLIKNCAWSQVVVIHNGSPWGWNRFPFGLHESNSHIHVTTIAPESGVLLSEPVDSAERRFAKTMAHMIQSGEALHDKGVLIPPLRVPVKFTWMQIAALFGYKNAQGIAMAIHRWRPICEDLGLVEPRKRRREDDRELEQELLKPESETQQFLDQASGQSSPEVPPTSQPTSPEKKEKKPEPVLEPLSEAFADT